MGMEFLSDERAQLGPFEELFELIVVVTLVLFFSATITHSYGEYEDRKAPIERFSSGLDFAWALRNNVLCVRVKGTPNPGLMDAQTLGEKGNFAHLSRYWNKPYDWEVVIRGAEGNVLYEFGSLNKGVEDPASPLVKADEFFEQYHEVSVVFAAIAYKDDEGGISPARMEVWVW